MFRNPFKALKDLLPEPPLQVGTVLSVTDEVAVVELPGGGTLTARGAVAVDDVVFVRNGVIEGLAPTLSIELVEI